MKNAADSCTGTASVPVLILCGLILILISCIVVLPSVPARAVSDSVVFSDWSSWQMGLTWYRANGTKVSDLFGANDVMVSHSSNFTKINNGTPFVSTLEANYEGVSKYVISTPLVSAVKYTVPAIFCNKDIHLSIAFMASADASYITPGSISLNLSRYNFTFFNSVTTSSSYTTIAAKSVSGSIMPFSGESNKFWVQLDLIYNFPVGTNLFGFYFEIQGNFDWAWHPGTKISYHGQTWILSDMILSDTLTSNDVKDAISGALDQHDQETKELVTDVGEEAVSLVTDAIGDAVPTGVLSNALSSWVSLWGYSGQSGAVITWPAITVPKLAGMEDSAQICDEYELDFSKLILQDHLIPDSLLSLCRNLLSISLFIFVVLEIMDLLLSVLSAFSVRVKE